jgi:hypothetical protein
MLSANPVQTIIKTVSALVADDSVPEHQFAAEYIRNGGNALAAHRVVFPDSTQSAVARRMDSMRLTRNPVVVALVADARRVAGESLNASVSVLAARCFEIATASAADLMPLDIHACRVCHSDDGRHPAWTDVEEFSDACEAWEASIKGPRPLRKPSAAGGFTYDAFSPVNPTCRGCRGRGVASLRVVATDELSEGARMLYDGATVAPDGTVRPMFQDRAKYADMLHKLLGHYVTRTESKNLNVSVNATEAAAIAARPADEIVRLLFSRKEPPA